MPLVQAARDKRDWLRVVAVVAVSMVLVSALWGAIVGAPAAALAGTIGSRRTMALIMQAILIVTGLLMLAVALGELGLIRRLLPEIHLADRLARDTPDLASGSRYRRAAVLAIAAAASFGIFCTRPLYLALLGYVALVGNIAYGALALGAYGLGLATSITLGGLALLPASRSTRLMDWFADRQQAFHVVQGVVFALMGALSLTYFGLVYGKFIPPA
jgi:cytochrome c biogenesis protein CcdA